MKTGDRVKRAEGTIIAETAEFIFVLWDDHGTPMAHHRNSPKIFPVNKPPFPLDLKKDLPPLRFE